MAEMAREHPMGSRTVDGVDPTGRRKKVHKAFFLNSFITTLKSIYIEYTLYNALKYTLWSLVEILRFTGLPL